MPLAQFTVNLEWCASEAHTRGESLLRGHGANRVKLLLGTSNTVQDRPSPQIFQN